MNVRRQATEGEVYPVLTTLRAINSARPLELPRGDVIVRVGERLLLCFVAPFQVHLESCHAWIT